MTDAIAALDADAFSPLVGETFDLDGCPLVLRKVEARDAPSERFRAMTSLVFTGPEELVVAGVHTLSHAAIGSQPLLVHRITSADEPKFEIVLA